MWPLFWAGALVEAAVVVQPSSLYTTEGATPVNYAISLDAAPAAGEVVTVTPNSGDVTEGTVSAALSFDASNYRTLQFVTVTPGGFADGNDGDVSYNITHTVTSNQVGGNYAGASAASVAVTNQNINGVETLIVSPASGLFVNEGGSVAINFSFAGSVTITNPASQITIPFTVVDSSETQISSGQAVLTIGNGFRDTITLTVPLDNTVDGNQAFMVTTGVSSSNIGVFNNLNPVDVSGFALDVDLPPPPPPAPVPVAQPLLLGLMSVSMGLLGALGLRRRRLQNNSGRH